MDESAPTDPLPPATRTSPLWSRVVEWKSRPIVKLDQFVQNSGPRASVSGSATVNKGSSAIATTPNRNRARTVPPLKQKQPKSHTIGQPALRLRGQSSCVARRMSTTLVPNRAPGPVDRTDFAVGRLAGVHRRRPDRPPSTRASRPRGHGLGNLAGDRPAGLEGLVAGVDHAVLVEVEVGELGGGAGPQDLRREHAPGRPG